MASDVEVLKLMIAHGAKVEWSPDRGQEGEQERDGWRRRPRNERERRQDTDHGGDDRRSRRGVRAGPGFGRLGPPPFREASNREPLEAVKVLLAAGADPNAKAPDGSTPLHQAVQARQVDIIRALVGAGAKLDAINKDNLTPLLLAEKPPPPARPDMTSIRTRIKPKRDTREDVIAALRELMHLGPNDPAPVPPPLPKRPTTKTRRTRRRPMRKRNEERPRREFQ